MRKLFLVATLAGRVGQPPIDFDEAELNAPAAIGSRTSWAATGQRSYVGVRSADGRPFYIQQRFATVFGAGASRSPRGRASSSASAPPTSRSPVRPRFWDSAAS